MGKKWQLGCGKTKMATRFFQTPRQAPIFQCLHSFMHHSAFKLNVIQLPLSIGYRNVLVVRIFSRWFEAFPCFKSHALKVTKMLKKYVSYLGYSFQVLLLSYLLSPPIFPGMVMVLVTVFLPDL